MARKNVYAARVAPPIVWPEGLHAEAPGPRTRGARSLIGCSVRYHDPSYGYVAALVTSHSGELVGLTCFADYRPAIWFVGSVRRATDEEIAAGLDVGTWSEPADLKPRKKVRNG